MPSHINDFVINNFDVDELELLLLNHHNNSERGLTVNYADFVNGFTIAMVYQYRDKFNSHEDRKWLRIRISMLFAPIVHKILN
jgi:hypothetical protein